MILSKPKPWHIKKVNLRFLALFKIETYHPYELNYARCFSNSFKIRYMQLMENNHFEGFSLYTILDIVNNLKKSFTIFNIVNNSL